MAVEAFDNLLELEDQFYKEGYDAGVLDGEYAGLVEGKVFGVEKGYEKALELGKLHGRAMVWQLRCEQSTTTASYLESQRPSVSLDSKQHNLVPLSKNSRLAKHVGVLLNLTNESQLSADNTDEAVADFDERCTKAQAKAKVISNIAGEALRPHVGLQSSIEEVDGLSARH